MDAKAQNASDTKFTVPLGLPELRISHLFYAPIEQAFKTWIDPEAIPHWCAGAD